LVAAEVRERGEHPHRLLDRARDERWVVDQLLALLRVLAEGDDRAADGRLRGVVAGEHQQHEAHYDFPVLELRAIDVGFDEHGDQVVLRLGAPRLDQCLAALEYLRDDPLHDRLRTLGVDVRVAARHHLVHQPCPYRVVNRVGACEAADHACDDRLRKLVNQVDRAVWRQ
jgi:hypothetical protein